MPWRWNIVCYSETLVTTSLHVFNPEVITMKLCLESVLLDKLRGRVFEKHGVYKLIVEWTRVLSDSELHCRVCKRSLLVPRGSPIHFTSHYTTLFKIILLLLSAPNSVCARVFKVLFFLKDSGEECRPFSMTYAHATCPVHLVFLYIITDIPPAERCDYEDRLYELIIHRKEILIPKV